MKRYILTPDDLQLGRRKSVTVYSNGRVEVFDQELSGIKGRWKNKRTILLSPHDVQALLKAIKKGG